MDELTDDREGEEPEESFAELLEQSLARPVSLEPGQKIAAKILKIGAEWVFLDVRQKGEGVLDVKELLDADGALTAAVGDTLHVHYLGNEEGELRFTTRIGGSGSGTAQLQQAWENGIPVEAGWSRRSRAAMRSSSPGACGPSAPSPSSACAGRRTRRSCSARASPSGSRSSARRAAASSSRTARSSRRSGAAAGRRSARR